jgi:hypothetical protein
MADYVDNPSDIPDLKSDDKTSVNCDGDSMISDRAGVFKMTDDEYDSYFLRAIARK